MQTTPGLVATLVHTHVSTEEQDSLGKLPSIQQEKLGSLGKCNKGLRFNLQFASVHILFSHICSSILHFQWNLSKTIRSLVCHQKSISQVLSTITIQSKLMTMVMPLLLHYHFKMHVKSVSFVWTFDWLLCILKLELMSQTNTVIIFPLYKLSATSDTNPLSLLFPQTLKQNFAFYISHVMCSLQSLTSNIF